LKLQIDRFNLRRMLTDELTNISVQSLEISENELTNRSVQSLEISENELTNRSVQIQR
jgi:hypothetical protein